MSHLAPTYAAINALMVIGTPESYGMINRVTLKAFLQRVHLPDGSFVMHEDGECDVRWV